MAFWRATDVDLPQNSAIVTVNTGDDVGSITSGYIIQINAGQFLEVKTVNTGASPQTIELYQIYTGTAISGGTAIAAPTQGAIKEATEELRNLRTTYETLADSVSSTATANSVVRRNGSAQVLVADATANNHAMAFGQYTDPVPLGIGQSIQCSDWPNSNLDNCSGVLTGVYRTSGAITSPDQTAIVYFMRRNAGQLQQILISGFDAGNTNTFQWRNSNGGDDTTPAWSAWKTVYHSGNSVNPIKYGLGIYYNGDAALIARSTESNLPSGLYTAYSPNNANASIGTAPLPSDAGAYSLLNMQGVSSDDELYTTQLAMSYDPNLNGMFFRTRTSGSFGGWNTIYHSGNTNFDTYTVAVGRTLKNCGIAQNTTTVDFDLEGVSSSSPTGVTVNYGTFNIVDVANGSVVGSSVTPTLASVSTPKTPVVRFTVSGATAGKVYRAVSNTGGAEFKVNY